MFTPAPTGSAWRWEPWSRSSGMAFCALPALVALAASRWTTDPTGRRAIESVAVLAREPAAFWVERAHAEGLPLTPVAESPTADLGEPFAQPLLRPVGLQPPRLGEHTTSILREFGASD